MTRFRCAAAFVIVAGISLVIHADGTSQSQSAEIQLQLGNLLFAEGQYQESLDAFKNAVRGGIARPDAGRAHRVHPVGTAGRRVRLGAPGGRAAVCVEPDVRLTRSRCTATRSGRPGSFDQAETKYRDALTSAPEIAARPARVGPFARRARAARAGHDRGAARRPPRAARPRDSSHDRFDLRADAQVRGSGRRVHQLRQPAAEQGQQQQGQLVARRDPVPAVVRPARAVRDRSRRGRQGLHRSRSRW